MKKEKLFSTKNLKKDGKREGYWEEISKDGSLSKGNYRNGVPDGLAEFFYPNGQLKCKFYAKKGAINGLFLAYYENGNLFRKSTLKNGKFNGLNEKYFENGQLEMSKT